MLTILFDSVYVYINDIKFEVNCSNEEIKEQFEQIILKMDKDMEFMSTDIYLTMGCGGKMLNRFQELFGDRVKFVHYEPHDFGPDVPGVLR